MIVASNYVYTIYDGDSSAFNISGPAGSAQIEQNLSKFYDSQNQAHVPTAFDGRSDYGPFLNVCIAAGGSFTGAEKIRTAQEATMFGGQVGVAHDVCYHKACDDISTRWGQSRNL